MSLLLFAPEGFLLAVTGGLACGKSTVGRLLAEHGVERLDTDEVAHDLMRAGTAETTILEKEFGRGVLAEDGAVDRKALASRVFSDPSLMVRLNAIVHPGVRSRVEGWARDVRARQSVGAVQIPLFFEAGIDQSLSWNAVLVVAASSETVQCRLRQRGISEEEALRRLAAQWPLEEKIRRATHVLWNNGSMEELAVNVRDALHDMKIKEKK